MRWFAASERGLNRQKLAEVPGGWEAHQVVLVQDRHGEAGGLLQAREDAPGHLEWIGGWELALHHFADGRCRSSLRPRADQRRALNHGWGLSLLEGDRGGK